MRLALRLALSTAALSVGGLILVVSLSSSAVTQVFSAQGSNTASQRRFYLNQEILPDHVAYPVLMAVDRAKLETASPLDQVYMQIEYGNRRVEYAEDLLKKDNASLAQTTLTKAIKYFNLAAQASLDLNAPDTTQTYVLKTLNFQVKHINELKMELPDQDRIVIDQLLTETSALQNRLHEAAQAQE